jgi:four helix bundle protein
MRPHEKLDVRRKAIEFVLAVYKATESFPKEEKFGLTSQVRRAAVSIPANLAEGAARSSRKEFAHFISNAQGSASEAETELLIAHRLGYLSETKYALLREAHDDLGKMLNGLARNIHQRISADS